MSSISRRTLLSSLIAAPAAVQHLGAQGPQNWVPLFDGRSLDGWKVAGPPDSFKVVDGAIAADGPRAHLYYNGGVRNAEFRNFELKFEAMCRPAANSGLFFHTRYQPDGFPTQGFEVQLNNTAAGEGRYRERKKTGSLYAVRNVYKAFARDDEWFPVHLSVRGKQVQIRVNDMLLVDFVEPDPPVRVVETRGRMLESGTFALQCHDPGSKAFFRNIRVRPLADNLASASTSKPVVDETYRELMTLGAQNYALVDYHVHLQRGWSIDEALGQSRQTGIQYGIAITCGKNSQITSDAGARRFLAKMRHQPVFLGVQAEGREWVRMLSKETVGAFDYVFMDAMILTGKAGKRMRLWIKKEVGEIADKQQFMDSLVSAITGMLDAGPIDIYANATFLPDTIAAEYDQLWTAARMEKVIEAAKRNDVAIEINNRRRLPSESFIKLAKTAGLKFAFGTDNTDRNIGRCEYGVQMVRRCGLAWTDMFIPKPDGEKPVQKRGLSA